MNTKIESCRRLTSFIAAGVFLFVMSAQQGMAQEVLSDTKKKAVSETAAVETDASTFEAPEPSEEVEGGINKWWLYGGAAALGIGAIALAGGGSSSSSSSSCDVETVGPDLSGSDWSGTLTINANGYEGTQAVTAKITHCGSAILINTTSALSYGKTYDGTIDSSGDMLLIEHIMRQDWTTHFGAATTTHIELYDFVNDLSDFDILELSRASSSN